MSNRLKKVTKELSELSHISGKNDKVAFIKTVTLDTLYMLKVLNQSEYVFGLKKQFELSTFTPNSVKTFEEAKALIEKLKNNNINDELRNEVVNFLTQCGLQTQEIMSKLFTKQLKLGVTANSINKAIPNLIPEFKVALADSSDKPIIGQKIIEVKYDGVRCVAKVYLSDKKPSVKLYTRQGQLMHFPAVEKDIIQFCKAGGITSDTMLDGELELIADNRLGISGVCNSNIKSGYTDGSDLIMCYTVFDIMPLSDFESRVCKTPQRERTEQLEALMFAQKEEPLHINKAKSFLLEGEQAINDLTNMYISRGLEGTITKDPDALYPFKRSKCWLKHKAVNSCTLLCVSTTKGINKRAGKIGALRCSSEDGKVLVNVGSGLTDELVDLFTKTPPIGMYIEIEYNVLIKSEDSDTYSLFLPRYKDIRIDKLEADSLDKMMAEHIGKIETK